MFPQARATLEREYASLLAIGTDRKMEEVRDWHFVCASMWGLDGVRGWALGCTREISIFSVSDFETFSLQDDDKNFRRAPSWRKKFRPKDVRGMSLGASDTLPANFRVTSSSVVCHPTQPKRSPMDGKQECLILVHVFYSYCICFFHAA